MSRSYKKHPHCTDNRHSHIKKKKASRILRRKLKQNLELVISGNEYKKVCESWDICDYRFRKTERDAIKEYYEYIQKDALMGGNWTLRSFPTEESCIDWWRKFYKSK